MTMVFATPKLGEPLTVRETEIRDAMCRGLTTKEIARDLCISNRTVEQYRQRLLVKTGARNACDLVRRVFTERMDRCFVRRVG